MQYKKNYKILIDKRKFDTLLRLNCPKEIIIDLIFENKLTLTGDSLIDDNLESLMEIKEFKNWGGNHNPKGNNQYSLGQVLGQVDQQVDHGQNIGQVVDKDIDKDIDIATTTNEENKDSFLVVEEEKENKKEKEEKLSLENWYGFYKNVHLTSNQYGRLLSEIANQSALDEIIEDLSSNIAQKKEKSPPYDEKFPDMHFATLKAYWKYRKLNGFKKPIPKEDKARAFKEELDRLTEHFRQKELNSG